MIKTVLFPLQQLEKFCKAEIIYTNRTFKVSPQLFYQLFSVHTVYNGQHICHTVKHIPTSSSHRQHHIFEFLKCTLSIPTSSTSHFVSHFVNIDQMGVDKVGIDKVGIDKVGIEKVGIDKCQLMKWKDTPHSICCLQSWIACSMQTLRSKACKIRSCAWCIR